MDMDKKTSFRAVSWWISWRELEWPSVDALDRIRRRADEIEASGADTAMVFGCHFRWDFLPWWGMLHDYLAHVHEELNKRRIRLFDHHSAVFVHRYDNAEQLRHIMMHQGSHLPVCPDRRSAASWTYNGQLLNSWRIIDVTTGKPLWMKNYDAEAFCPGNPNFVDSYCKYVRQLCSEADIDGLMCDDASFPKAFCVCSCPSCRERLRRYAGVDLPDVEDKSFWGNWENPSWRAYLELRCKMVEEFYANVRAALPSSEFPLLACCSGCCTDFALSYAFDLSEQLSGGCNIANLEIVGNTPPGPMDGNVKFSERMIQVAHHVGIADSYDAPVLAIAYGFIEENAKAAWSLVKSLGGNLWFSTLPYRLGLRRSRLDALQGDAAPAASAFNFEREHPELFNGDLLFRCSIFFSYNTRNNSAYGSMAHGFTSDFQKALGVFLEEGLVPKVVTSIPDEPCGPLVLPCTALLSAGEIAALKAFMAKGGKVIAFGPCGWPGCSDEWKVPMRPSCDIIRFADEWMTVWGGPVPPVPGPRGWRKVDDNFIYNPDRLDDGSLDKESLLEQARPYILPIAGVLDMRSKGFFATVHRKKDGRTLLFFVATDYDVMLNEELEAERQHRTRVNIMRRAAPKGQCGTIEIALEEGWRLANVILPFGECAPKYDDEGHIMLSEQSFIVIAEITS